MSKIIESCVATGCAARSGRDQQGDDASVRRDLSSAGAGIRGGRHQRLRDSLKFSQPVFALHLHTTASTVRKWEQGETRPAGPALKLLNVIADKGLQAIL